MPTAILWCIAVTAIRCMTTLPSGASGTNLGPYTQDDAKQEEHGSRFCILWQQCLWHCEVLLWAMGALLASTHLQQGDTTDQAAALACPMPGRGLMQFGYNIMTAHRLCCAHNAFASWQFTYLMPIICLTSLRINSDTHLISGKIELVILKDNTIACCYFSGHLS